MKNIAVILCGSGFKDGSEIRESVAALWALSKHGAKVQCFAPTGPQYHVVNCLTGDPALGESRDMLVESARIARGQVKPLNELKHSEFDGIVLPGGFGAAKNLCDFAFKGSNGNVRSDLKSILRDFHNARKPIGAICIAPAIVALAFKDTSLQLTFGESSEAGQEIEKLGHKHIETKVTECHVDQKNKIVSTGAYMFDDAKLVDLFQGIENCISAVINT